MGRIMIDENVKLAETEEAELRTFGVDIMKDFEVGDTCSDIQNKVVAVSSFGEDAPNPQISKEDN